jgi:hypothetical protein
MKRKSKRATDKEIRAFFEEQQRKVQSRCSGQHIELRHGYVTIRRYTRQDAMRDQRKKEEQRIADMHPLERRYYTDPYNHHRGY